MAGQKGNTNKPIDDEPLTKTISMRFTEKEFQEIEKIAKELELPKTRLMRNFLLSSLEDAKILNKIGILKGTKKLLDFKEKIRDIKNNKYSEISV